MVEAASAAIDTNPTDVQRPVIQQAKALGHALAGIMRDSGMDVVMDGEKVRQEYENSLPIAVIRQYSKELSPRDIGLDPASYAAKLQKISERLNALAEKRADSTDQAGYGLGARHRRKPLPDTIIYYSSCLQRQNTPTRPPCHPTPLPSASKNLFKSFLIYMPLTPVSPPMNLLKSV